MKRHTKRICWHGVLRVMKHRGSRFPCLHCEWCTASWGDLSRALMSLRRRGTKVMVFSER